MSSAPACRQAEQIAGQQLNALLGEMQSSLLESGLHAEVKGPERELNGDDVWTSEIRIYFHDFGGDIQDAIEFFVVWQGRVNEPVTLVESLREDIDDVIKRYGEP